MNTPTRFRGTSVAVFLLVLTFFAAIPTVANAQWGRRTNDYRRNDTCSPRNDNGYNDRRNRPSERWVRERGYDNGYQLGQRQAWQDYRNGLRSNYCNWVYDNGMQGFRQEWIHDGNYRTGFRNGYREGYLQAYRQADDRRGGGRGWGRRF